MTGSQNGATPIRELGEVFEVQPWLDYRAVLPADEYREPYLLSLLNDDSFAHAPEGSPLPWVPLHAWRALGQMRSLALIDPVLRLAEDDAYIHAYSDFEKLSAELGEPAIDPLVAILADQTRSVCSRTLSAVGLGAIGRTAAGATRSRIIEELMDQIRNHAADGWINGAAAGALIAMQEHAVGPELLRMYKQGHIQGFVRKDDLIGFFGPLPG